MPDTPMEDRRRIVEALDNKPIISNVFRGTTPNVNVTTLMPGELYRIAAALAPLLAEIREEGNHADRTLES